MFKPAGVRPTCRWLVAVIAAATVLAACGSDDRSGDYGPPCDCPEFIKLIDTIDWAAGHGSTTEAAVYMGGPSYDEAEPKLAHAIFAVRPSPLDPQAVAAHIVQVLADEGLEVSEGVRSGLRLSALKVSYDVMVAGGELTIWSMSGTETRGAVGFHLRSVPNADALRPDVGALGLVEHASD